MKKKKNMCANGRKVKNETYVYFCDMGKSIYLYNTMKSACYSANFGGATGNLRVKKLLLEMRLSSITIMKQMFHKKLSYFTGQTTTTFQKHSQHK